MKKLLAVMLMFTFVFALVGCGKATPESIEITGPLTVEVGSKITLTAKVLPAKADQSIKWESFRPENATINEKGEVTGIKDGITVIKAISTVDEKISKTYSIKVSDSSDTPDRPNLQGYVIKIAQAGHALYETDPFHQEYAAQDRDAKQKAWRWVEKAYNVKFEVAAYPDDAEWGTPRWEYIERQAESNKADYDFYTVPDSQISRFVEGNAIYDIDDWYAKYGNGYMDPTYRLSGSYDRKLYSITAGESGIYGVMYYNINLLNELNMPKTPAQMFLDGEWTYSAFKDYAIAAQAELDKKSKENEPYYAVAGNSPYYWTGMSNAGGVRLANVNTLEMDIKNPIAIAAADTLKAISQAKAMSPAKEVDAGITSWMAGRALFASGDLWFVNTSNRWKEDLWGAGDDTKYGYVPFPRPDGTELSSQRIGLGGTATLVMPIGRDYSTFGEECTTENIYRALVETFQKTEEYLLNAPGYNEETYRRTFAEKYAEEESSIQAFIWMLDRIKDIGFYDPLATPDNPIVNTGYSTFSTAVHNYIKGDIDTFAGAVDPLLGNLTAALTNAFKAD